MNKTLLLALASLLLLPSAASAATANADIKRRGGANLGPVSFKAAKGELNKVTVTDANGRLRFHDSANRVKARGDCEQIDRHTALCPFTEDIAKVRLGDRGDSATVEGLVEVFGGKGNDLLRGSTGDDRLDGERGNDTLHGLGQGDDLRGGPGRDRVFGGSGDDVLIDGETDGQAATDVYRGGSSRDTDFNADRGDTIDYSLRKKALDIDLSRGRAFRGPERDVVRGLESVEAGSGNDRLSGDGDDNYLEGSGGDDRIRARGGSDIPMGGPGADRVSGEDGDDTVWGDSGTDVLSGGDGDDQMISRDSKAETVSCGAGNDVAPATRVDTLVDCEVASSSRLQVKVQPEVQGNKATFQVSCVSERGCSGTLTLSSLSGAAYGTGTYADIPHGADSFTPVEMDLTPDGKTALRDGEVVQMTWGSTDGGFRAFMQG